MAIDKKERNIIGRALRSHRELATNYTIEGFQIGNQKYTALELADLIENDHPAVEGLLDIASSESRENLAKMMAYRLTPRKNVSYGQIERAYQADGILGWLSALRDQIGVGDFDFNDGKKTHLDSFSKHFVGERCKYYGRTIDGKYLDTLTARFGIKKARESRY